MFSPLGKKPVLNFLAAGALGLLAGFVLLRPGDSTAVAQQTAAPSVTIATLNLNDLVPQLYEQTADTNALKQKYEDFQSQLASKKADLQNLQAPLDPGNVMSLKPGTPEYETQQNKLLEATMAYQTFDNYTQQLLLEDKLQTEIDLYKHVNDAVAQYAKDHGISLVLVSNDINYDFSQKQDPEQDFELQIASRKVMYTDPSLDITKALAQQMNSDYQRASGGAAPVPEPMPDQTPDQTPDQAPDQAPIPGQ